jgi:hypothetical protein
MWLSVDPLAHKYPSMTPYNYVENNPLRYFDPNGEYKMDANQVNAVVNMLTNYAPKYFVSRNRAQQANFNSYKSDWFQRSEYKTDEPYIFETQFSTSQSKLETNMLNILSLTINHEYSPTTYFGESKEWGKFEIYTVANKDAGASGVTVLNISTIDDTHITGQELNTLLLKNSKDEVVGRIFMTDEQYKNLQNLIYEQRKKEEESQNQENTIER